MKLVTLNFESVVVCIFSFYNDQLVNRNKLNEPCPGPCVGGGEHYPGQHVNLLTAGQVPENKQLNYLMAYSLAKSRVVHPCGVTCATRSDCVWHRQR